MEPCVRKTYMQSLSFCLAALALSSGLMMTPAAAGSGDLAVGLLGGLAAGTVIGSAVAQPRYYAPYYYYAPAPVYVPAPRCWFEQRRVWDGFGYLIEPVRICQ
jgi:hypothetical protein